MDVLYHDGSNDQCHLGCLQIKVVATVCWYIIRSLIVALWIEDVAGTASLLMISCSIVEHDR